MSPGQTASTDFLYDLDDRLVATVGSDYKVVRTNLYGAGQHWADFTGATTASGGQAAEYRLGNEVGTLFLKGDGAGNFIESCVTYPFGEALNCSQGIDYTENHFVDTKRDQESGLDYMGARYYSSNMGRFSSPDPSGMAFTSLSNPQSFNMYSYVQNNPLNSVDPDGLDCVYVDNDSGNVTGFNRGDCDNSTDAKANSGYYFNGTVSTLYTTTGDLSGQLVGVQGTSDDTGGQLFQSNPAGTPFAQPNGSTSSSGMDTTIDTWGPYSQTTQFNHGTHPFRDNNPGDMMTAGGFSGRHGAIGSDGRVAVFPGVGTGRSALDSLLRTPNYQSMTVSGALAVFAPANENNTAAYQQFIQNVVGVSGNAPLSSLSPSQMNALENGIARYEGFNAAGNYSVSVTTNF